MNFQGYITRFNFFLKEENKKPYGVIVKEFLTLWIIKKEIPFHYFSRFLYRKGIKNCRNFLSIKEYYNIVESKKINPEAYTSLLSNKIAFAFFCEKNKLPIPKTLGYNHGINFFKDNEEAVQLKTVENIQEYFYKILIDNNIERIFVKPIETKGGRGVFLITKDMYLDTVKVFYKQLLQKAHIFQEVVVQHEALNAIYPDAINTVRLDCYIDDDFQVEVFGAVMRFGQGKKIVDNVSQGGFFVPVDINNATLQAKGMEELEYGGRVFYKHPDTNYSFEGFKIPFFEEAITLVKKASTLIPNKLIGWDIAITPTGPCIIEGNNAPGFNMAERAMGGFCNHPIIIKMQQEIKG